MSVYCDFCTCEDCKHGRKDLTHALTSDGRWICLTCYQYEVCIDAKPRGSGPCESIINGKIILNPDCGHRPKLVGGFIP